ncbi:MAG: serine/threonine protein phosphatase [Ktedonobacterales bacterium]|nr:serine/threonine protein phosphatase [Ktedonobacterales bacterium]
MLPSPLPATYAIGDIHGEVSLLRQLMALLPHTPADTIVFLGDYLDRGEDSLATIRYLIALQQTLPHVVFLRGNHEDAWLSHWDGVEFTGSSLLDSTGALSDAAGGHIPYEVGHFLEETVLDYEDEHAIYVHAGLPPGQPPGKTADIDKMWGPHGFLISDYHWGKTVVFGHMTFDQPLLQPNKIGIDTGAYATGVLTAVRLPDRAIFQTPGKRSTAGAS